MRPTVTIVESVPSVVTCSAPELSKWNPADVTTHEAFRREQVVMGLVKGGKVVFANEADRQRLVKRGAK